MDYAQAEQVIRAHDENMSRSSGAVAEHRWNWKKLEHRTWLAREPLEHDETGGPHYYALRLFQKEIITFYQKGVTLDDHGFFSYTTHNRFNKYLPRGFRVYGATDPRLRRLFGYIKTPMGVFPYTMPATFEYSGHMPAGLTNRADEAIRQLPTYANEYLERLLDGGDRDFVCNDKHATELYLAGAITAPLNDGEKSQRAASIILANEFHRHLLTLACAEKIGAHWIGKNTPLENAVEMLVNGEAAAFKSARTQAEVAQRMELVIKYKRAIEPINRATLRSRLRKLITDYLIERIGFAAVEWNRRA